MYVVKQSTALTIPVYVHDVNGDAVLSLVNAGFTKRISKGSGAFAAMTVTVTEMENGWYSVPLSTSHTNTLGLITITLTHASAKQVNIQFRVEAKLNDDLNDIAATAIVSGGAINTTGGAVDTVTTNTDMVGTDNAALATAMATAQLDLDTLTGTDGVTLATAQGNYAPNVVVPDVAGTAPTAVEVRQEIDSNSVDLNSIITTLGVAGAGLSNINLPNQTIDITGNVSGSVGSVTGSVGSLGAQAKLDVNAEADTALSDYNGPTNVEMEARTPTAAQLAYIVSNSADGLPVTFTGGTTTTAILGNVDGSAASSTNDVYNGRILIFNAGTLNQQATDITAYVGSTKTATITAVTTAVTISHTANLK